MKLSLFTIPASLVLACTLTSPASADVALAARAGTLGYGADFDVGLTKNLTLRLGYNTFDYKHTLNDTDVTYDGHLKIGSASALLDWHVFHGGFRVTVGGVQKGPKVDVVGVPTASATYELNGNIYSAADIGTLSGTIKMGTGVAPYVGFGWGNTVDDSDRITFLLDIGAIHTGAPTANVVATCSDSLSTTDCATLQAEITPDIQVEVADLEKNAKDYEWYPVISLGLAVRF